MLSGEHVHTRLRKFSSMFKCVFNTMGRLNCRECGSTDQYISTPNLPLSMCDNCLRNRVLALLVQSMITFENYNINSAAVTTAHQSSSSSSPSSPYVQIQKRYLKYPSATPCHHSLPLSQTHTYTPPLTLTNQLVLLQTIFPRINKFGQQKCDFPQDVISLRL